MKRLLAAVIVIILLLVVSCGVEFLSEEENVNDYIYPFLEFTPDEDGEGYVVTVVGGAELEEIYIPAEVEVDGVTVQVTSFGGFENPEDAKSLKVLELASSETTIKENALEKAENIEDIKVDSEKENAVWGLLPVVEKEGKEFIGWFIQGTSTQVFEGDPITNSVIEPRFRDHTLTKHEGKPATCMSSGWEEYVTCSTCSYTTYKEIPKLSHSLTHHSAVNATCTEDGIREYWLCSNCHNMFSDESGLSRIDEVSILATGHKTYQVDRIDAECGKEGKKGHWECERCHSLFSDEEAETSVTEAELIIPALEHIFIRNQLSAESTCTWDECTLCHETTNPTGHSWDEGKVQTPATETSKGVLRYTCTKCGITMDEDIVPLDDSHTHVWGDKETVQKTCTKRGYVVRECSVCHIIYNYKYDDAEGHKTTLVEAKDATCTEDGNSRYYECSVCSGFFKDKNAINLTTKAEVTEGEGKLGHAWSDGYESNTEGHWHTCRRCSATSELQEHTYDRTVEDTAHIKSSATCTEPAYYYYSCICGRNGTETFSSGNANGHEKTYHAGQSASCIREGWYEYWTCSRCEKSFYDEACTREITEANKNVIPKTSHTDSGTYTSAGQNGHQKYCSVCKMGYGDTIKHTIQDFEWGGADSEYHWHICRYCSFQADKTKHDYVSYGTDEVCSVCLHTKVKEQTTSGGFNIQTETLEPKGTLTVTGSGSSYHAVFTIDTTSRKTGIEWYLDDDKQSSELDDCDFTTPEFRTYIITCVLYNGNLGSSYSQKVYGGGTP